MASPHSEEGDYDNDTLVSATIKRKQEENDSVLNNSVELEAGDDSQSENEKTTNILRKIAKEKQEDAGSNSPEDQAEDPGAEVGETLRAIVNSQNRQEQSAPDIRDKDAVTSALQAAAKDIEIQEEKEQTHDRPEVESALSKAVSNLTKNNSSEYDKVEIEGQENEGDIEEADDAREPLSEEENKKFLRAAFHGDLKTAKKMLDSDYSVNGMDRHGWTALHWSVSRGHYDFSEFLIRRGAKMNQAELTNGWTPLHIAAINDLPNIAALLLKNGSKKQITDRWGDTPYECTVRVVNGKKGHAGKECRKLLKAQNLQEPEARTESENETPNVKLEHNG